MAHTWREELAWAAGFFDGEGCTRIRLGREWAGQRPKYPALVINQNDPAVLQRFQAAVLGIGKIHGPVKYDWMKNPRWDYAANGSHDVQAVIAMLWSFLGEVKRAQAAHVLTTCTWSKPKYRPSVEIAARTCRRGHTYEGNRTKHGQCRACMREDDRRRYAERKKD